jgi:hypothetical protein
MVKTLKICEKLKIKNKIDETYFQNKVGGWKINTV